ncbi:MAG: GTPase HflX [Syntrophomonadaceae bacterium]|nr:GTPase HflX [Syntrophomonadaceae bacterium]
MDGGEQMGRRAFLIAVEASSPERGRGTGPDRAQTVPAAESLVELGELVRSRGYLVVGQMVQSRPQPDARTYLGKGKVAELGRAAQEAGADLVVCDDELTPVQARNLERETGLEVLDRTGLILEIFAERAHTREGKLQVELARLQYLLPRLTGRGTELSRLGGGIATRGPGEQQMEIERRHLVRRIRELQQRIEEMKERRRLMRQRRTRRRVPVVALVGYTNAGKSTLMEALTGSAAYADERVFATLDPQARAFRTPSGRTAVLTDTVGFVRKLPHQLVAAFRATLEEVLQAQLLVHVVDGAAPGIESRIAAVESVLARIGATSADVLLVFNKADLLGERERAALAHEFPGALLISARTGEGLAALRAEIDRSLAEGLRLVRFLLPPERGDLLHELHQKAVVLAVRPVTRGMRVEARVGEELLGRLRPFVEREME